MSILRIYFKSRSLSSELSRHIKILPSELPQTLHKESAVSSFCHMATNAQDTTDAGKSGNGDGQVRARVILQQCLWAKLMVQPATDLEQAKYVHIDRGLIIYLCFMKGADEQMIDKMVKTTLGARLSENDEGKRVSVLERPGDILIIPQATLGGALKGKSMQYHKNINKETGLMLYTKFVSLCEEMVTKCERCREKETCVKYGTYGNRQVFSTETNGPYTHMLEF